MSLLAIRSAPLRRLALLAVLPPMGAALFLAMLGEAVGDAWWSFRATLDSGENARIWRDLRAGFGSVWRGRP